MRVLPYVLLAAFACSPLSASGQEASATAETDVGSDDQLPVSTSESEVIDASSLHSQNVDEQENAGASQSASDTGWVRSSSVMETSSSSTTLTVGDQDDDTIAPTNPDAAYAESRLAGRWLVQGQESSCTVTLTSTRWGNSGYRFNGPAGCPGSLISGVSWSLQGSRLVVKGPVSPIVTFSPRGPNRWEGSDKDGNWVSLTR